MWLRTKNISKRQSRNDSRPIIGWRDHYVKELQFRQNPCGDKKDDIFGIREGSSCQSAVTDTICPFTTKEIVYFSNDVFNFHIADLKLSLPMIWPSKYSDWVVGWTIKRWEISVSGVDPIVTTTFTLLTIGEILPLTEGEIFYSFYRRWNIYICNVEEIFSSNVSIRSTTHYHFYFG